MKINIPEKITTNLHVVLGVGRYNKGEISVFSYAPSQSDGLECVEICETQLTIDLPPNFDVTEKLVATLEAKKGAINQEYSLRLKRVNDELAELRALPASNGDH